MERTTSRPTKLPGKILVPVDFSPTCRKALSQALALAGDRSRIVLLHVLAPEGQRADDLPRLAESTKSQLQEFARALDADGAIELQTSARIGVPFQEILNEAHEQGAELIVIATRSSESLGNVSLSRTSERISRYAQCPVLLVHADDRETSPVAPRR